MAGPAKRNGGAVTWAMGAIMVTGILGVLGVAFSNQAALAKHQRIERAHPPIAVKLDTMAADLRYIRHQLDVLARRHAEAPNDP